MLMTEMRLITSQIDTAPKRVLFSVFFRPCLITSQIDTAPKLLRPLQVLEREFDYQSDRHCAKTNGLSQIAYSWFDYQSDRHCAKTYNWERVDL